MLIVEDVWRRGRTGGGGPPLCGSSTGRHVVIFFEDLMFCFLSLFWAWRPLVLRLPLFLLALPCSSCSRRSIFMVAFVVGTLVSVGCGLLIEEVVASGSCGSL